MLILASTFAVACSGTDNYPAGSLKSEPLSAEQMKQSFATLRAYATARGFDVTEDVMKNDLREVVLMDLKRRGCLAVTADNLTDEDVLLVFFFECPGVEWKSDYSNLEQQLQVTAAREF